MKGEGSPDTPKGLHLLSHQVLIRRLQSGNAGSSATSAEVLVQAADVGEKGPEALLASRIIRRQGEKRGATRPEIFHSVQEDDVRLPAC
jgi:hypothetical protein